MDGGTISLMGLVVVNIAAVAYSYGMTRQELKDHNRRLGRIEKKLDKIPACKEER